MDAPVPVLEPVLPPRRGRRRRIVAALAIPAVAIGIAYVAISVAQPRPTDPGRLVIVEVDGGLAVMDATGESVQRHGAPGLTFQFPAWSPDGTRIAAIGTAARGGAVHVLHAADLAADPTIVYSSPDRPPFYLHWSPDGARVSFLTTEPGGIALRVVAADGSGDAAIVREAAPLYWDWVDPDRLLVHTGANAPEAFVGEIDLDGASFEERAIEAGIFRAPAVSPEGRFRAYVGPAAAASGGPAQAIVVEARDGSTRHTVPAPGSVAIGFDPTASSLAFIAPREPVNEDAAIPVGPLRAVDAATGEVRTLRETPVVAFFWSPDGRTIAALEFVETPAPGVDEAGTGPRVASAAHPPPLAVDPPGVGLGLAFVDAADGTVRSEREVRISDLFAFQVLPFFDQYALSHRFWSADSRSLVLPIAADGGRVEVVVFPADGSNPRALRAGTIGAWSPN